MPINEEFLEHFIPPGMTIEDFAILGGPLDFKAFVVRSLKNYPDESIKIGDNLALTILPGGCGWYLGVGCLIVESEPVEGVHFEYEPGFPQPPDEAKPPKR